MQMLLQVIKGDVGEPATSVGATGAVAPDLRNANGFFELLIPNLAKSAEPETAAETPKPNAERLPGKVGPVDRLVPEIDSNPKVIPSLSNAVTVAKTAGVRLDLAADDAVNAIEGLESATKYERSKQPGLMLPSEDISVSEVTEKADLNTPLSETPESLPGDQAQSLDWDEVNPVTTAPDGKASSDASIGVNGEPAVLSAAANDRRAASAVSQDSEPAGRPGSSYAAPEQVALDTLGQKAVNKGTQISTLPLRPIAQDRTLPSVDLPEPAAQRARDVLASLSNGETGRELPTAERQPPSSSVVRSEVSLSNGTIVPTNGIREATQVPAEAHFAPRDSGVPEVTPARIAAPMAFVPTTIASNPMLLHNRAAISVGQAIRSEGGLVRADPQVDLSALISDEALRTPAAEPGRPEPASSRSIVNQIIQQISRASGDGVIEIRLQPEELGRVRLSITPLEAGATIQVTAERAETLDLIRRNIDLLERDLLEQGFESLEFSFGSDGAGEEQRQLGEEGDEAVSSSAMPNERIQIDLVHEPQQATAGRLDIRV